MFKRWMEIWPILLLCTIATGQMVVLRFTNLTPWKGGGFGMFSTIARPETRIIHIFLDTPEGLMAAQLPEPEDWKARQLRALPTRDRLEALRQRLSRYQWLLPAHQTLSPTLGASPYPPALAASTALIGHPQGAFFDPAEFRPILVKAIRVEIHQLGYDPASRQVKLHEIPL